MDKGYKEMMQKYAQQQKDARKQPKWADVKLRDATEPDEFTVTHVNQTFDLVVSFSLKNGFLKVAF